jgi:hypothetical protein
LQVTRDDGVSWIGNFDRGDGRYSAVLACPYGENICVVAEGAAYLVPVFEPSRFVLGACYPVIEAQVVEPEQLLLLLDNTRVAAYSASGLSWKKDVGFDGLRLEAVSGGALTLRVSDPFADKEVIVQLDLLSGAYVSPPPWAATGVPGAEPRTRKSGLGDGPTNGSDHRDSGVPPEPVSPPRKLDV